MRRPSKKHTILVTAGPTREKIDPIRFISNYSTGTFGYEIAREAERRGNRVFLVTGPTILPAPAGVTVIRVESAAQMRKAVLKLLERSDIVIMAAAVSDWRASAVSYRKIKKGKRRMALELAENPDILAEVGRRKNGKVVVGFALETEDLETNAARKLKEKHLDMIVANNHSRKAPAFGKGTSRVLILDRSGERYRVGDLSKRAISKIILDKALNFNI